MYFMLQFFVSSLFEAMGKFRVLLNCLQQSTENLSVAGWEISLKSNKFHPSRDGENSFLGWHT